MISASASGTSNHYYNIKGLYVGGAPNGGFFFTIVDFIFYPSVHLTKITKTPS